MQSSYFSGVFLDPFMHDAADSLIPACAHLKQDGVLIGGEDLTEIVGHHGEPVPQAEAALQLVCVGGCFQHADDGKVAVEQVGQRAPKLGHEHFKAAEFIQQNKGVVFSLVQHSDALNAEDLVIMRGRGDRIVEKTETVIPFTPGSRRGGEQIIAEKRAVRSGHALGNKAAGIGGGGCELRSDQGGLPTAGRPGYKQMFFHTNCTGTEGRYTPLRIYRRAAVKILYTIKSGL